MNGEIAFLSRDDVLRLHRIAIEDQGGDPSIRDVGLLDSALAQPRAQVGGEYLHPSVPAMAAAYAFHICNNHPFVDGNKRAAFAALVTFLLDNGWRLEVNPDEATKAVLDLAAGSLTKEQLTEWVRRHAKEDEPE